MVEEINSEINPEPYIPYLIYGYYSKLGYLDLLIFNESLTLMLSYRDFNPSWPMIRHKYWEPEEEKHYFCKLFPAEWIFRERLIKFTDPFPYWALGAPQPNSLAQLLTSANEKERLFAKLLFTNPVELFLQTEHFTTEN